MIEVIITIVIGALALAAILPYLGAVFMRSNEPRVQLVHAVDLQAAMEDLVSIHTNELSVLHQHVGNVGEHYQGRFMILENHYVSFPGSTEVTEGVQTNLLKITLQNELGETITRLFSVPL